MDLLRIFIAPGWEIQISLNGWIIVSLIILFIMWVAWRFWQFSKHNVLEISETEIGIGPQKIKIKPNYDDLQVAYKFWVELSTRKLGLPIDYQHDVIIDIYNSWYEFFKITRNLIKDIPVSKMRNNESTRNIIELAVDVLNEGLRPHLTTWQARFRKWYEAELKKDENIDLTPQDLQKNYPHYVQLIDNMDTVNKKLISYRDDLKKMVMP